jgi:hypothetical protein
MKQALEAITNVLAGGDFDNPYADLKQAGAVLKQAIEQAENQEPVAFRNTETGEFCTGGFLRKDWAKWQPLYTTPPAAQRTWVGLTDEERSKIWGELPQTSNEERDACIFAQAIEAKLKEKNGG